jgi:hypothetical protein
MVWKKPAAPEKPGVRNRGPEKADPKGRIRYRESRNGLNSFATWVLKRCLTGHGSVLRPRCCVVGGLGR